MAREGNVMVQYGDSAVFDRRCRHCMKFMKVPDKISYRVNMWTDEVDFAEVKGDCKKHGAVQLLFLGHY